LAQTILAMQELDAINILKDIIKNGIRHKYYNRTVEKANEYRTIITGEGIENYMQKFPRRETDAEFKQRIDLTVNITETVSGNIIDPQKKVSRSNSIEKTFLYVDNSKEKYDTMKNILATFKNGRESVDDYMSEDWIELNNLDPNSLIVVDWKTNTDGGRIKPYPVEYPSHQVYHFNKTNGELNWVCVHRDEQSFDPEMYILYAKDFTVLFTRKYEDITWNYEADTVFYKEFPINDFQGVIATYKDRDTYWDVHIPQPHNLGLVPATFVGHVVDLYTRETYLSSIYKAIPILKKIVKANSELDLTMALHAYPQKVQYTDPCPDCNEGRMRDGTLCQTCNGTGNHPKQVHQSALDIMQIPRPRDKEDMFDLSKMIYYVPNDTSILRFQEEYVEKLTKKCKEAVYNSEVFTRKDVSETAYGKNIDLQNVYDALWPMAKAYAKTQNFLVDLISRITNLNQNLLYHISFRKDFKMKSLTDIYMDLELLGRSDAAEFIKREAENDAAEILYENDESMLQKHYTMNHFFPFNGKTKKEIEIIITGTGMVNEKIKALWANFSWIFDELELEFANRGIDFYNVTRDAQKEAIDAKVEELIKTLETPEINVGETLSGNESPDGQVGEEPVENNQ